MSGQQAPSAAARHTLETLELAIQGTRAYEREDLAARLSQRSAPAVGFDRDGPRRGGV